MTTCPQCGDPAWVEWRCVLESTDGPIEHVKIRCVAHHWFLLPVETLARLARPANRTLTPYETPARLPHKEYLTRTTNAASSPAANDE